MKKLLFSTALFVLANGVQAAVIEQVIVRQQWPWSTDVKVEYKLSGVTGPVDLTVKAYNGAAELPLPETAISGDRYGLTEDGIGQLVIDPVKAFGTAKVALANFKVKLSVADAPASAEVLYKIIDMTTTPYAVTDVTRADLLNGKYGSYETSCAALGIANSTVTDVLVWTGVTNNPVYKTDKLVLRKIPAKNQTFAMGTPENHTDYWRASTANETLHNVTLTNDFWSGVFELTGAQSRHLLGYNSGMKPVTGISYNGLRGTSAVWPGSYEVAADSILGKLRKNVGNGMKFDLPTEAEWEYACSGGTQSYYVNCGSDDCSSLDAGLGACGWFNSNSGDDGGSVNPSLHEVGQKRPNAWGLYDMHGNVMEWCLDWMFTGTRSAEAVTDPVGAASGTTRIYRSGWYSGYNNSARTQAVGAYAPSTANSVIGCRIFCRIPNE